MLAEQAAVDSAFSSSQAEADDSLQIAVQALLDEAQAELILNSGDVSMFILDMPPVPPQSAPLMIAQASQAQQSAAAAGRTVGVCHIVGNATGSLSPENLLEPALSAMTYFRLYEHRTVNPQHAKVTVLQDPKHGLLKDEGNGIYSYLPSPKLSWQGQSNRPSGNWWV